MKTDTIIAKTGNKELGSAGGIFYEVAAWVIKQNGVVYGASYDNEFMVHHVAVDCFDMLYRVLGVKYSQSVIDDEIKQSIKCHVESGKLVLFSGTPCQVSQVRDYLGNIYQNFYTVAVNCDGVVKPEIWKNYLDEKRLLFNSAIENVSFPYKGEFGVSQNKVFIKFSNGTAYLSDEKQDELLRLKHAGYIYADPCYRCQDRDIHKADFFMSRCYDKSESDSVLEDGLTEIQICSKKGRELWELLSDHIPYRKVNTQKHPKGRMVKKAGNIDWFWRYYHEFDYRFAAQWALSDMDKKAQNRSLLPFFEKLLMLDSMGYKMEELLLQRGIDKMILYGYGVVGKIIAMKLKDSKILYGITDKTFLREEKGDTEIRRLCIEQLKDSDVPIVVTPFYFFQSIQEELAAFGVEKKRLISLRMLVNWAYDDRILQNRHKAGWRNERGFGGIYLITGAAFYNKGSQSMLFTAMSELRKKNPECDLCFLPIDDDDHYRDILNKYKIHVVRGGYWAHSELYELLPHIKAIVDISGYALSSKWDSWPYIHMLSVARYYHIPIYYMPQSFGPFDFDPVIDAKIKKGLSHAVMIYAREQYGYDLLTSKYGLTNVMMSKDLVLQNRSCDLDSIYVSKPDAKEYYLCTECNVGIVPNIKNYEFGQKEELLLVYKNMIEKLLSKNKNVYLISHSNDREACDDLFQMFTDHDRVHYDDRELDCLEYRMLVRNFEYLIASRYHSIIHAYQEGIPCIAFGWAEKYKELLKMFEQQQYHFDVRKELNIDSILHSVDCMDQLYLLEAEKIRRILPRYQQENCFDVIV